MNNNSSFNPHILIGKSILGTVFSGARARCCLYLALVLILASCAGSNAKKPYIPEGFADLTDVMHAQGLELQIAVRYFGENNFVGEKIDGYQAEKIIISEPAAKALVNVQRTLVAQGLSLKVFDAYRPQQAVDHFVRWARDLADTKMKAAFYPRVAKSDLFEDGYIAARSGHSRGSTIDLTLVNMKDGKELDMGTPWDFFDLRSWSESDDVSSQQQANRKLLREVMLSNGFKPLAEEWWHFTLVEEPYPDTYFDFLIE